MSEVALQDFSDYIFGVESESVDSPQARPVPEFTTRRARRDYERSQDPRWRRTVEAVADAALNASSLVRAGLDFPYRNLELSSTQPEQLRPSEDDGTGYYEYVEADQRKKQGDA